MSKLLYPYDHLPPKVKSALADFEQIMAEVIGKTLTDPLEYSCFVEDGRIVGEDCLVDAFNTIVAALSGERQP